MMTKKELFNAKNCGVKMENGTVIDVVSVGTFEDTDKDGNVVTATALVAEDGTVYTAISATIASSVDLLDDILADDGKVTVKVTEGTSNNGRTFKHLMIL